ncbi:MAG: glycerol-3-phosphate 1-O-acyltransferase PlsY [Holosporaceae bacterium]|jgi:glycerol-3-phosphate acyltransferase PlsY|nr:glycerol-3-phosphate 1-O-acyltransferase PlsY [Holosporaceae bacterium]
MEQCLRPLLDHLQLHLYLCPLLAYLIGSVPFGLIFSHIFGKGGLRESGSGNIGATNVLRTQGKFLGTLTFFVDFVKATIAYRLLMGTGSEILELMTLAAPVVGHIFPVWLKFKGGKGVATYFGILLALDLFHSGVPIFLISAVIWLIAFFITKISSAAGLISVFLSLPVFACSRHVMGLNFLNQLYVLIGLVVLIFLRHRGNIRRLLKNNELGV